MSTTTLEKVKTIKTLNNIAEVGLKVFNKDNFTIDNNSENPGKS
jgi:D-3-phosphoglycerate dehydrogenase / 2-oxoglutarate reductase